MQYTLNQRLFLVKHYWITNSITATQRAYQREFGVRNPPKRNTILGLVNKLETTGSLVSEKGKHRSSRLPTVFVDVRARLEQSPKKSLRRLSQETGYTYSMNLWPPRSPDLTTPDFFLWGYLKNRVYATRPQTLDDPKHNITQEIQAIDNRVLQRVASNMERRVELCLMQDGGHFQHLLQRLRVDIDLSTTLDVRHYIEVISDISRNALEWRSGTFCCIHHATEICVYI
ncbi:hypothetical protein ANN_14147 [Periplaneta americana]|uniref:DUF4817 domain-containing protein n=1 Tax=Periplaneta americana TaxID=6978 RepID=A0ABQ8SVH7_PERAM|nr:hypothetical protein ANN_14147 [Periplaneta americana]